MCTKCVIVGKKISLPFNYIGNTSQLSWRLILFRSYLDMDLEPPLIPTQMIHTSMKLLHRMDGDTLQM